MSELTTRVDLLKKERERLDAQLSMDSAVANYGLALEQQKLSAKAAELQAQAALGMSRFSCLTRERAQSKRSQISRGRPSSSGSQFRHRRVPIHDVNVATRAGGDARGAECLSGYSCKRLTITACTVIRKRRKLRR
jgi:hypothetical protein